MKDPRKFLDRCLEGLTPLTDEAVVQAVRFVGQSDRIVQDRYEVMGKLSRDYPRFYAEISTLFIRAIDAIDQEADCPEGILGLGLIVELTDYFLGHILPIYYAHGETWPFDSDEAAVRWLDKIWREFRESPEALATMLAKVFECKLGKEVATYLNAYREESRGRFNEQAMFVVDCCLLAIYDLSEVMPFLSRCEETGEEKGKS